MKPVLRLSTRQNLALTPQIQQTIRMLQLGAKELNIEIDETLYSNPLLQESKTFPTSNQQFSSENDWLENIADSSSPSLESHLIHQLTYLATDRKIYLAAITVISCLDESGFLRLSTTEIVKSALKEKNEISHDDVNQAIQVVRQLDPIGIGCSDLIQCFKLQIVSTHYNHTIKHHAMIMCENMDSLVKDASALEHYLQIPKDEFNRALELIQKLNPSPAKEFNEKTAIFIQPDILLQDHHDQLSVQLNPAINRGIELNHHYIDLLKSSKKDTDRAYLKENFDSARWWMNALTQRNSTLLSVATFMINYQKDFFRQGKIAIKPLKQQQIADTLEVHVSTVSRAIQSKYIQTPTGIIELKALLAGEIKSAFTKNHSDEAVKQIIRQIIDNEPSQRPLSDSKIVIELKERGISIARRTVNKYRDQLSILASNRRKAR